MDKSDKDKQVERALRGIRKTKTRDEQKEQQQLSKRRKQEQKQRKRVQRDWADFDDDEFIDGFEKIATLSSREAGRKTASHGPTAVHDWVATEVHSNRIRITRGDKSRDALLGGNRLEHGPPVVGDRIAIEELAHGQCRITSIEERESWLSRTDPRNRHQQKFLAANVDRALVALAAEETGRLRPGLIERIRVALGIGRVEPIVVVTKVDRLGVEALAQLDREIELLRGRGVKAIATSSLTGHGIDSLRDLVAGFTVVVVGHSGVGKSTLLNALDPSIARDTGGVRESDDRGRHTTTSSSMTPLTDGGWLIDTPGIRQFGVSGITRAELLASFPRLHALAAHCPRGCAHTQEDCALRVEAEAGGEVAAEVGQYLRILTDLDD